MKPWMAGETAKIKVQDGKVEVCCKEIREDSVLITVDGKPMELKLGQYPEVIYHRSRPRSPTGSTLRLGF